jgi:hypothetical protein
LEKLDHESISERCFQGKMPQKKIFDTRQTKDAERATVTVFRKNLRVVCMMWEAINDVK